MKNRIKLPPYTKRNYGSLASDDLDARFATKDIAWDPPMGVKRTSRFSKRKVLGTCPGGDAPIVARFTTKDAIYAECECGVTWWFRYPLKKPKNKPKKKPAKSLTTEKMGDEITVEQLRGGTTDFLTGQKRPAVTWSHGGKPRCPNHHEPFEVSYLELKEGKGRGQCPVSGAYFYFEVDPQMEQVDKFGNRTKAFKITGNEN